MFAYVRLIQNRNDLESCGYLSGDFRGVGPDPHDILESRPFMVHTLTTLLADRVLQRFGVFASSASAAVAFGS